MRIKVLLAEGDRGWKNRLSKTLNEEPDMEVETTDEAGGDALESVDVVIVGATRSRGASAPADFIRELAARRPGRPKIIMLATDGDRDTIVGGFQSGAVNVLRGTNGEDVVKAIRDAYDDRSAIHPDSAAIVREELMLMSLTPTEREVYRLKRGGYSKKEIADRLTKSENTVKTQMRSIREKLSIWG